MVIGLHPESANSLLRSRLLHAIPLYDLPRLFFSESGNLNVTSPSSGGARSGASATAAAAVAASEEGDEDAEEGDNAVDEGVQNVADAGDDSHDGVTDGSEEALNTRDDGAHFVLSC